MERQRRVGPPPRVNQTHPHLLCHLQHQSMQQDWGWSFLQPHPPRLVEQGVEMPVVVEQHQPQGRKELWSWLCKVLHPSLLTPRNLRYVYFISVSVQIHTLGLVSSTSKSLIFMHSFHMPQSIYKAKVMSFLPAITAFSFLRS